MTRIYLAPDVVETLRSTGFNTNAKVNDVIRQFFGMSKVALVKPNVSARLIEVMQGLNGPALPGDIYEALAKKGYASFPRGKIVCYLAALRRQGFVLKEGKFYTLVKSGDKPP